MVDEAENTDQQAELYMAGDVHGHHLQESGDGSILAHVKTA